MNAPERCMCGATDCRVCGPLQGYRIYGDGISESAIESATEELILNAATEPAPLGMVLHSAFCDDPDLELQDLLSAVIRRVLQGNYPEARQSALAAQAWMQAIAKREDLFRDEAIKQIEVEA